MLITKSNIDEIDDIISELLIEYEKKLNGWKNNVKINSKKLETACVEQASWLAYYDEMKVQLKALVDYYEMREKEVRSKSFISITRNASLTHTDRAKEIMIDSDPEYLKYHKLYMEIKEMYSLCNSIVDQFRDRAFTLNNIVKIRTAALEDVTLFE